jgi:hypothetical protein
VVPLSNAEFLDERLPNDKLVVEAGHLVWEEPDEYASLIADRVAGLLGDLRRGIEGAP